MVSWGTDGPSYLTTSAVAAFAAPFVWLTLGGVVGTDGSLTPGRSFRLPAGGSKVFGWIEGLYHDTWYLKNYLIHLVQF